MLKATQEGFVIQYIRQVRSKDRGIGGMKLWYMYRKEFGSNHPVGRDRFADIVDRYGLKVRARIRKPRTTDSTHGLPVYPNIVKNVIPVACNQLWVSDITYITIWIDEYTYVFCYLSMIMDAYSEEIVGWSVGPSLETACPIEALRKALIRIEGQTGVSLIHHSDRGCQYASQEYISLLKQHGIRISMTESGDPRDNAQAERINGTIKNELLKDRVFHSIEDVKKAVSDAVDFYNNERPHMSINMMTPLEASCRYGEISKRWTSYRLIAIKKQQEKSSIAKKCLHLHPCQGFPFGLRPSVNP
jgi:transposase InsO family protein